LHGVAEKGRGEITAPEARVVGRGRDVNAQPKTRQAALALDARSEPRAVRELDLLQGPAEVELPGLNGAPLGREREGDERIGLSGP
jgi:hypothetical protein